MGDFVVHGYKGIKINMEQEPCLFHDTELEDFMFITLFKDKKYRKHILGFGLKWRGFKISQPSCLCCDAIYINFGFITYDILGYYAEH